MDKTKCITFDKSAQDSLSEHIKAKMKADREKARAERDNTDYAYCIKGYEIDGLHFDSGYIEAIPKGERFLPNEYWRFATVNEIREFYGVPSYQRPKGRY